MKKGFAKKICVIMAGFSLITGLVGCGKGNSEDDDPYAALREEVVSFVNEELASISADRDDAVAIYNDYFTSDNKEPQVFLDSLNNEAIPKMQTFVDNLTAIETESDEVANLKDLYLQGSQKQLDAMNKVALAITEENTDYLTEADNDISESKSYFTQYESALKLLAIDCNITINGSFTDASSEDDVNIIVDTSADTEMESTEAASDGQEATGSIQEVTE
jgi:hypothetical protein